MDYLKTPQQLYAEDLNLKYSLGKHTAGDLLFREAYRDGCPDCLAETSSFELDSFVARQWDGHESVLQRQIKVSCGCGNKAVVVKSITDLRESTSTTRRAWDELEADFLIRHPENIPDGTELRLRFEELSQREKTRFLGLVSLSTLKRMGFDKGFINAVKRTSQQPPPYMSRRKIRLAKRAQAKLERDKRAKKHR